MNILTKSCLVSLIFFSANQTAFCQEWTAFGNNLSSEESIYEVDLSDDGLTAAIGSPFNNNNVGNHGTVRAYHWNGSNWTLKGSEFVGENSNDNLGYAVALNSGGNTMVIGSPNNDEFHNDAGKSDVYSWNGSSWDQMGNSILGEGFDEKCGWSVSINNIGDIIAIGAFNNGSNGVQSGHVRVFQWDGSEWTPMGSPITGEAQGDRSGYSVDLDSDGTTIAIGAITNSDGGSSAGHARVFTYDGTAWVQKGGDIDGTDSERFGRKLSLSGDGNRLVVGAAINFDDNTGFARVYEWDGTAWIQMGSDFVGEHEDAELGSGVALNEDGTTLVVGSPGYEGSSSNNGQLKIYTWQNNAWIESNSTITGTPVSNRLGRDVDISSSGDYICFSTSSVAKVLKKDTSTSINSIDAKGDLDVRLVPNPATRELRINAQQEVTEVVIANANGQIVAHTLSPNTITINHLPAGIYFVTVKTASNTFVKKLVKNP